MSFSKSAGLASFFLLMVSSTLTSSFAQTIAIKDFPRLIASVTQRDEIDTVGYSGTQFVRWWIDPVGSFRVAQDSCWKTRGIDWLYVHDSTLHEPWLSWSGHLAPSSRIRRFNILMDGCGFEGQDNVLSCWELKSSDSISLTGIDVGQYQSGIGNTWIRKVTQFPDSSVLICTEDEGADGGEAWGGFTFLREVAPCQFDTFYRERWDTDIRKRVYFNLDNLISEQYRVVKTTVLLSEDSSRFGADDYELRPETARAEVIDLWRLAVEAFKIDTMGLRD